MEFLDMLFSAEIFKKSPFSNSITYPHMLSLIMLGYLALFFRIYFWYLEDGKAKKKKETAECRLIQEDGDKPCKQLDS